MTRAKLTVKPDPRLDQSRNRIFSARITDRSINLDCLCSDGICDMKSLKVSWKNALVFSAILHLSLGVGLVVSKVPNSFENNKPVEIEFTPSITEEKPNKVPDEAKRIVEQDARFANNKEDPTAKFLSEKSQTVEKETLASRVGTFQNSNSKRPSGKVKSATEAAAESKEKATTQAKTNGIKDLFKQFDPSEAMAKKIAKEQMQNREPANLGDSEDPSQTQDYAKEVNRGAETMLNTREFRYYTYYNRIRKQLNQYWQPKVKEKVTSMFRRGRHIASDQDRITKLLIVLNDAGTLVKVQVLSDSGISDLDDAAIEAFRAAAPFPNPPQGIIEKDGTVQIRWDFILES